MQKRILNPMIFIFCCINCTDGYKVFYMKESGSCSNNLVEINVGSVSKNSSGILTNAYDSKYEPEQNCTIFLRPPLSYGIVASIRSIDLQPLSNNSDECENFLEISHIAHQETVKLCGYSYDEFEFKSFTSWGPMRISFHTSNSTDQPTATFRLTFTAVRNGNGGFCFKNEKRCHNHNCIWKGLTCDGHNNCGDLSDEIDKHISQCAAMTPGESLAVILVTISGSLVLLIIAACLRGNKITRQIENLSQRRHTSSDPEIPILHGTDLTSRYPVSSINRVRTNYGSTSQLLTSCDFSDVFCREPPPRYEDVQASSQVTVTIPPIITASPQLSNNEPTAAMVPSQYSSSSQQELGTQIVPVSQVSAPRLYVDSNPPGT